MSEGLEVRDEGLGEECVGEGELATSTNNPSGEQAFACISRPVGA